MIQTQIRRRNADSLTDPLTKIVNASINEAKYPNDWKSAIVVPIFKTGDPTVVSNYRPVSILPTIQNCRKMCCGTDNLPP